jgi:flagellar hook assembly protein FlgD
MRSAVSSFARSTLFTLAFAVAVAAGRAEAQVDPTLMQSGCVGHHEMVWDGRDDSGRPVPNGVYFAQLETGQSKATRRLTRMR